jgi:hypothetical protein
MKKFLCYLLISCFLCTLIAGCKNKSLEKNEAIDIDLPAMGSMMRVAMLENIYASPNDFTGKTIRMGGQYFPYPYDDTGKVYHYVVFFDGSECCSYGLEFALDPQYTYPNDYPKEESHILITGSLKSYEESGRPRFYLAAESITVTR